MSLSIRNALLPSKFAKKRHEGQADNKKTPDSPVRVDRSEYGDKKSLYLSSLNFTEQTEVNLGLLQHPRWRAL